MGRAGLWGQSGKDLPHKSLGWLAPGVADSSTRSADPSPAGIPVPGSPHLPTSREERAEAAGGRPPRASPQNAELEGLEAELSRLCAGPADGFLLYLLGLVRLDGASLDGARQALVAAVRAYPANWCAWKALQRACPDLPAALALGLPEHPARAFFLASLAVDLHDSGEALGWLEELAPRFPASDVLVQLAAEAHYNLQNFDEAQALFEDLLARDPHRLEVGGVGGRGQWRGRRSCSRGVMRRCGGRHGMWC